MMMAAQHAIDEVSESGLATTRFVTAPQGVPRAGPAAPSAAAPAVAPPRRGSPRAAADGGCEERAPSSSGRPPGGNANGRAPRRSIVGAALAADDAEDTSSRAAVPSHLPKI